MIEGEIREHHHHSLPEYLQTHYISEYNGQLQIYINESQGSHSPYFSDMVDKPDQLTFCAERISWLEAENRRLHGALAFSSPKTTANYLVEMNVQLQGDKTFLIGEKVCSTFCSKTNVTHSSPGSGSRR